MQVTFSWHTVSARVAEVAENVICIILLDPHLTLAVPLPLSDKEISGTSVPQLAIEHSTRYRTAWEGQRACTCIFRFKISDCYR